MWMNRGAPALPHPFRAGRCLEQDRERHLRAAVLPPHRHISKGEEVTAGRGRAEGAKQSSKHSHNLQHAPAPGKRRAGAPQQRPRHIHDSAGGGNLARPLYRHPFSPHRMRPGPLTLAGPAAAPGCPAIFGTVRCCGAPAPGPAADWPHGDGRRGQGSAAADMAGAPAKNSNGHAGASAKRSKAQRIRASGFPSLSPPAGPSRTRRAAHPAAAPLPSARPGEAGQPGQPPPAARRRAPWGPAGLPGSALRAAWAAWAAAPRRAARQRAGRRRRQARAPAHTAQAAAPLAGQTAAAAVAGRTPAAAAAQVGTRAPQTAAAGEAPGLHTGAVGGRRRRHVQTAARAGRRHRAARQRAACRHSLEAACRRSLQGRRQSLGGQPGSGRPWQGKGARQTAAAGAAWVAPGDRGLALAACGGRSQAAHPPGVGRLAWAAPPLGCARPCPGRRR